MTTKSTLFRVHCRSCGELSGDCDRGGLEHRALRLRRVFLRHGQLPISPCDTEILWLRMRGLLP